MNQLYFNKDYPCIHIKQELNKTNNLANKKIVKYELLGYLISGNIEILKNNKIKFSTESDYNINRFSKLLENLKIDHSIEMNGKNFVVNVKEKELVDLVEISNENICIKENVLQENLKEEELKAIIRGAFLGSRFNK